MARKRKKLKHLDYNSQEYWNRLLAEDGLSMSQGEHPKLVYVEPQDLLSIESCNARESKFTKGDTED